MMPRFLWRSLLVISSITLIVTSNESNPSADWWKHVIVYQIYPRSFQDSDGDGVGDIRGIISRLDHFTYINVDALWLSPVYKSPMVDHGYDVEDFTDIDPIFGTLADFDELVFEAHKRGIRIIMDYIPNHTSNKHKWFVESRRGGTDNQYADYYIWSDGLLLDNGTRVPPNNWQSIFVGSAWTWDSHRSQFYYHKFCAEQPDLNYRNQRVRRDMEAVFQFWLDRGVDGFRVDAIATLFEVDDLSLNEEPYMKIPSIPSTVMDVVDERDLDFYLDTSYTRSRSEIHEVVREWRHLLDRNFHNTGKYTFMVVEVYETIENSMKYYSSGADMPLNMWLIMGKSDCHAACFRRLIETWLLQMPAGSWPNFVIGNHDRNRISKRKGKEYVNAMNILLLTLPGTPVTYYGEEIGMNEIELSYEDTQDPFAKNLGPELYLTVSRDSCRSPMQWDDSTNAGFSNASKSWLPVNIDHTSLNVGLQRSLDKSPLEIYRRVAQLRKETPFRTEHIVFLPGNDFILAYVRYNPNANVPSSPYLIAMNLGPGASGAIGTDAVVVAGIEYSQGLLILDSMFNSASTDDHHPLLSLRDIHLENGQAYIIQLIASPKKDEL